MKNRWKHIFIPVLAMALCLSLAACGGAARPPSGSEGEHHLSPLSQRRQSRLSPHQAGDDHV